MNNKIKKYGIVLLVILILFSLAVPTFADELDDEKAESNWALKIIGKLCYGLGLVLQTLFFSEDAVSLNTLVYNQGAGAGVILNQPGPLREFFVNFYMIFYYMAVMFFIPMGLWIGMYFTRAGDDSQKRVALKDKIFKMFTTIVLLSAMPTIIDFMFAFNNVLVSIFYSVVTSLFATAGPDGVVTTPENAFLIDLLREQASNADKTVGHQIAYLMSVVLNIWLIFYYFIRDITIGFLFVLFPILAIFYPFAPSMIMTWFKEMASNIGTQTIHAAIFAGVIAMATMLPYSFYNTMLVMTAFASVIPMTGIIKRLFGMEGNIGGAASMAGMAMMMGAVRLGSGAVRGVAQRGSEALSGARDYLTANSEEKLLRKGHLEKSDNDRELSSQDYQKNLATLQERKAQARKNMYRGTAGAVVGVAAGVPGTVGGLALGSSGSIMMGAVLTKVGTMAGSGVGRAGGAAHNIASGYKATLAEEREDLAYEQIQMEQEGGRIVGDFQDDKTILQQRKAIRKQKMYQAMGMPLMAQTSYARAMPTNASQREIESLNNAKFYQDKNRSLIYTEQENGKKTVHWLGKGNEELLEPMVSNINKSYGGAIDPQIEGQLYQEAEQHAKKAAPGAKENDPLYIQSRNNEYRRLLKEQENKTKNFQQITGMSNMSISNIPSRYNEGDFNSIMNNYGHLQDAEKIDLTQTREIMGGNKIANAEEFEDGYGMSHITKEASVIFKANESGHPVIVATAPGDSSLGTNSTQYSRVAFQHGKMLEEKIQYALHNNSLDLDAKNKVSFDTGKLPKLTEKIPANSEVIVTINNPTGVNGTYDVYNATGGEFIGSEAIPDSYNEMNGEVYHITVDANRNMTQYGINKQMSTRDVAIIEGINQKAERQFRDNQIKLELIKQQKERATQAFNEYFEKTQVYRTEQDVNNTISGA